MLPGYAASAGAQAIEAQVMSRTGDPDGATKARAVIASSAVHEGFHAIVAPIGRGWPAWTNESLANHFALWAARKFLAPGDMAFFDAIFAETDTGPLLEAQRQYERDPDAARDLFYRRGPVFWTRIETILVNRANASGRLAALLRATKGFRGVDTNDAAALAAFLDRYSAGRARSIMYCYLEGRCVSPSATGTG